MPRRAKRVVHDDKATLKSKAIKKSRKRDAGNDHDFAKANKRCKSLEVAVTKTTSDDEETTVRSQCDALSSRIDSDIKELYKMIPERKMQIDMMTALLSKADQTLCPAVFVHGNAATGKSLVVHRVLEIVKIPTAYVNCGECYNAFVLCEAILHQLSNLSSNGKFDFCRCENVPQFVEFLKEVIDSRTNCGSTCIVIDKAERLCTFRGSVLFTLLRLQEICQRNICVILLSRTEWSNFSDKMAGCSQPLMIYFPNYSKTETLKILSADCKKEQFVVLHQKFLGHLWEVFSTVCRSLNELRHLSLILFPKYMEPVIKGKIRVSESRKLWQHINPSFKQALNTVYHHSTHESQQIDLPNSKVDGTADAEDIPYHAKFLLIASFLASYNMAKTDKRYFSDQKETKRKQKSSKSVKMSTALLGPNSFPFSRLIMIFRSITENQITLSVNLLSQVRSLVALGFLSCVTDRLESGRYKCMVSLDFILTICTTVQFNLSQYLQ